MIRNFLITIIILFSGFFFTSFCLAEINIPIVQPPDCSSGCNCDPAVCGESPIEGFFQWTSIAGAAKYLIEIDQFTQAEDNIYPQFLPAGDCSAVGNTCIFYFIDLTSGNINYSTEEYPEKYCWNIVAYDASGVNIGSSAVWCFVTEIVPEQTPPEDDGDNGDGDDGGPSLPIELQNPIECQTIECVINALINFFFFLIMALAPIMIIISTILLATSAGNPAQIIIAQKIISWTIIALFIALLAKGVPSVIKGL